jgi:orotate phosphoribosyltransferase
MTKEDERAQKREWQKFMEIMHSCIRYGEFTLHSGRKTDWLCDLLLVREMLPTFCYTLKPQYKTVGIELGGFLMSGAMGSGFIRKDGTYYPRKRNEPLIVTLVDDVVTTETSLKAATEVLVGLGLVVGEYICILDRRNQADKTLEVRSLVTAADLGLES